MIDNTITENEIDKSLRSALKNPDEIIPVRGPKNYKIENYEYRNDMTGDISRFEGREEIYKNGKLIYYAIFHGGFIK